MADGCETGADCCDELARSDYIIERFIFDYARRNIRSVGVVMVGFDDIQSVSWRIYSYIFCIRRFVHEDLHGSEDFWTDPGFERVLLQDHGEFVLLVQKHLIPWIFRPRDIVVCVVSFVHGCKGDIEQEHRRDCEHPLWQDNDSIVYRWVFGDIHPGHLFCVGYIGHTELCFEKCIVLSV